MPSMHVPFVQPASLHNIQFSFSVAAALPAVCEFENCRQIHAVRDRVLSRAARSSR